MVKEKERERWQYVVIKCYNMLDSIKEINEYGDNGWEFCCYDRMENHILLKRRR